MSIAQKVDLSRWKQYPRTFFKVVEGEGRTKPKQGEYVILTFPAKERKIPDQPKAKRTNVQAIKEFFGAKPTNPEFSHLMSAVLKVSDISDDEERKRAILQNINWVRKRTEEVIEHGRLNILQDKNPWLGLDNSKGLPISPEVMSTSGDKTKLRYNLNALAHHLALALTLKFEQGADVRFYLDMDDTLTRKKRPFLTRDAQSPPQIFWLHKFITAASNHLGIKISINSNRHAELPLVIASRGFGLETPQIYEVHYDPYSELTGTSPKNQLEISRTVGVNALSTAYQDIPGEDTELSDDALLACDIFNLAGQDFIDRYIHRFSDKYEPVVIEVKGFSKFLHDTKRIYGKVSESWLKKLLAFKEECNQGPGDLRSRYETYKEKVITHLEEGDREVPKLEKQKEQIELLIEEFEKNNSNGENNKEISTAREELQKVKERIISYVRLIGSDSDDNYLTYIDKLGRDRKNEVINLHKCLTHNPQFFVELLTKLVPGGVCIHTRNSRNIPCPEAIEEARNEICPEIENAPGLRKALRHARYHEAIEHTKEKIGKDEDKEFSIDELEHPNTYINKFIRKGREVYKQDDMLGFVRWQMCEYIKACFSENEILTSPIFKKTSDGSDICLNDDYIRQGDKTNGWEFRDFASCISRRLNKSNKVEKRLTDYIIGQDSVFNIALLEPKGFADLPDECFFPDTLNSINFEEQFNRDHPNHIPPFGFEDKRTELIPWGKGAYCELLPGGEPKPAAQPTVRSCFENTIIQFNGGDSTSDLRSNNRALHSIVDVAGVQLGGGAIQTFNHLSKVDYINRAISKRLKDVDEAKTSTYKTFSEDYNRAGIYGLEKVIEGGKLVGYRKILEVEDSKAIPIDDTVYPVDQIRKEMWEFVGPRIYFMEDPANLISTLAEITSWFTGEDMSFDYNHLEAAAKLHEKEVNNTRLSTDERELVHKYRIVIDELKRSKYLPSYVLSSGVYFEYLDPDTGKKYYRMGHDKKLATKDGEYFSGDEKGLVKKIIEKGIVRDEFGVFVYRDNNSLFDDPNFLTKCSKEEEFLPSLSPTNGLFSNTLLTKFLGGGNIEKGQKRLRTIITKLPNFFSSTLAWCGGLLSLGGVIRLAGYLFGGLQEKVYSFGYWTSQIVRAASALGGACRGLLNVNKYYAITIGEFINIGSALFAKNGPKHLGFALGNLFLLTGRGMQNCQRQLGANVLTKEEWEAQKPIEGIIDPRPFHLEITRFSTEKIMLPIKRAVEKAGINPTFGHFVGSAASTILTTLHMLKDVLSKPKLLLQLKKRVSDKSGNSCHTIPSTGHLFGISGLLSGIGATCAGIFGRSSRVGDTDESGFNGLGKWLISFATFIQSIPIIFNGLEIAANQNGISRISRGLDGKTIRYNPERAGYGQVFSGVMFLLLSWFDLSKQWAAALWDTLAMGTYFGFPFTSTSVAEEDKINALENSENILFENDQFLEKRPKEEYLPPEVFAEPKQKIAA